MTPILALLLFAIPTFACKDAALLIGRSTTNETTFAKATASYDRATGKMRAHYGKPIPADAVFVAADNKLYNEAGKQELSQEFRLFVPNGDGFDVVQYLRSEDGTESLNTSHSKRAPTTSKQIVMRADQKRLRDYGLTDEEFGEIKATTRQDFWSRIDNIAIVRSKKSEEVFKNALAIWHLSEKQLQDALLTLEPFPFPIDMTDPKQRAFHVLLTACQSLQGESGTPAKTLQYRDFAREYVRRLAQPPDAAFIAARTKQLPGWEESKRLRKLKASGATTLMDLKEAKEDFEEELELMATRRQAPLPPETQVIMTTETERTDDGTFNTTFELYFYIPKPTGGYEVEKLLDRPGKPREFSSFFAPNRPRMTETIFNEGRWRELSRYGVNKEEYERIAADVPHHLLQRIDSIAVLRSFTTREVYKDALKRWNLKPEQLNQHLLSLEVFPFPLDLGDPSQRKFQTLLAACQSLAAEVPDRANPNWDAQQRKDDLAMRLLEHREYLAVLKGRLKELPQSK